MVLVPGKVSESLFYIPIELSGIHGEKIINALRDCLVLGEARKKYANHMVSVPVILAQF